MRRYTQLTWHAIPAIDCGCVGNSRGAKEELLRNSASILDLQHDMCVMRNSMDRGG